jgi:hypothetical protein
VEMRKEYKILVKIPAENRALGRSKHRWKIMMKFSLGKYGWRIWIRSN